MVIMNKLMFEKKSDTVLMFSVPNPEPTLADGLKQRN